MILQVTNVTLVVPLATPVLCTIAYKRQNAAGPYLVVENNVTVNPDGTLPFPVLIMGLLDDTWYNILCKSNCGTVTKIEAIKTPKITECSVLMINNYAQVKSYDPETGAFLLQYDELDPDDQYPDIAHTKNRMFLSFNGTNWRLFDITYGPFTITPTGGIIDLGEVSSGAGFAAINDNEVIISSREPRDDEWTIFGTTFRKVNFSNPLAPVVTDLFLSADHFTVDGDILYNPATGHILVSMYKEDEADRRFIIQYRPDGTIAWQLEHTVLNVWGLYVHQGEVYGITGYGEIFHITRDAITQVDSIEDQMYLYESISGSSQVPECTDFDFEEEEEPEWIEDTYTCEQDSPFTLDEVITGFSSPHLLMYDETSERMYGIDVDDPAGNFFSYDPVGFSMATPITKYMAVLPVGGTNFMFGAAVDKQYRRLYASGRDSNGIQVLDIATNSVSVIAWGCNHNVAPICGAVGVRNGYPRTFLQVVDDQVIGLDKYSATMILLLRTVMAPVIINYATIPMYDRWIIGSPVLQRVGAEYWVANSQSNSSELPLHSPNIFRYSLDFATLIGQIDLSAHSATWTFGAYIRAGYHDEANNRFYIFEGGTSKMIVIDTTTQAIILVREFKARQGKSHIFCGFLLDPITSELYASGTCTNATNDPASIPVTYKINRATSAVEEIYPAVVFSALERVGSSNIVHGPAVGNVAWGGGAWSTDGQISIFTR